MADRPILKPNSVIPAALGSPANGSSMAANITSAPTVTNGVSMVSYGVSWSGSSPVGALTIQCSNDFTLAANGQIGNAGTWSNVGFYSDGSLVNSVAVSGNTGSAYLDMPDFSGYAIRLVYTASSGTGTLAATVAGKVH